jgi:dolichol-phosphate mannosyltransferase
LSSSADFFAVIDGDLQHDENLLPRMLEILQGGELDAVIGSRYMPGGGVGSWDKGRVRISRAASWLAQFVLPPGMTDPMSGFFMIRRTAFEGAVRNLSGIGFKILVDLFASSPRKLKFQELPYEFRTRQIGESKLGGQAAFDFIMLILGKKIGSLMPVRFASFALVGASGVLVHLGVFFGAFQYAQLPFTHSNILAALVAMTSNFTFNNLITYRDRRLRGWAWGRGLVLFTLACSVGAVANVGVAHYLFEAENPWFPSVLAGIVVGTVWNYATTSLYVWRESRKS